MKTPALFILVAGMFVAGICGCHKPEKVIASLSDAQDARIGVTVGTVGEIIAAKRFPHAAVETFDEMMDSVAAMKAGKLDAVIAPYPGTLDFIRKNPEFQTLPESLADVDTSIAVKKGNGELLAKLNEVITQLREDGTLADLKRRWISTDSSVEEKKLTTPSEGKVLKIGVTATREPFTYADGTGRLTGHDIELSRIIANRLHRPVEFSDMKFMALIPSLQAGKIDMIVTGMTATDERRKFVDFTQPYFANAQVLLVKKAGGAMNTAAGSSGKSTRLGGFQSFLSGLARSFQSNLIEEKRYLLLWDGLKTSVGISILASIFGTLLGALVCFMRMSGKVVLTIPAKIYIAIMRGTPVLVLLMLIFYVVFAAVNISPVLVAVITFGMNFSAYSAEIFRTGIEGVDKGQTEAGISIGFTRVATFLNIILPQTVRRILPVYKGEFISLVKMTSVVGYIAVQDLTKAGDIIRSRTFDAFFPLVLVAGLYFAMSWVLIQGLEYLERRTDPKRKRRKKATR